MLVGGKSALFFGQVCQECESLRAICGDAAAIDRHRAAHELTEVVPVEIVAVHEFPHQADGIETVPSLPKLEDDESADVRLIEGTGSEYSKVVDVARLVSLIARTNLLRDDFRQGETGDRCGRERSSWSCSSRPVKSRSVENRPRLPMNIFRRHVPPLNASRSISPRSDRSCSRNVSTTSLSRDHDVAEAGFGGVTLHLWLREHSQRSFLMVLRRARLAIPRNSSAVTLTNTRQVSSYPMAPLTARARAGSEPSHVLRLLPASWSKRARA